MEKRLLLASTTLLLLASCGQQAEEGKELPLVNTVTAEQVSAPTQRSYTFISEPYRQVDLSFRVGGPVKTFDVQSGQHFSKGQLIAAIDERDFLIRKERAEALYRQAEADYRRVANLYEKNNISGTSYEKARADYAQAKAEAESATNAWQDTRLTAPFDGYVQQVCIERYQDVKASMPVVSFIDLSRIKIQVYVPEDLASSLRTAEALRSACRITFDALPEQVFTPSEAYLTRTATSNNISFQLTALIDNPSNSLPGGMAGSLSLSLPLTSTPSVLIPQAAVCHNAEKGSYVWTVGSDNRVSAHPVRLGRLMDNNRVEVTDGLDHGQRIAASRLTFLQDGQEIATQDNQQ